MSNFERGYSWMRVILLGFNLLVLILSVLKIAWGYNTVGYQTGTGLDLVNWVVSIGLLFGIYYGEKNKASIEKIILHTFLVIIALFFFLFGSFIIAPWGVRNDVVYAVPFYLIPVQIIFHNVLFKKQSKKWVIYTLAIFFVFYVFMIWFMGSIDDEFERWRSIIAYNRWSVDQGTFPTVGRYHGIMFEFDKLFGLWSCMIDCSLLILNFFLFTNSFFSYLGHRKVKKCTE